MYLDQIARETDGRRNRKGKRQAHATSTLKVQLLAFGDGPDQPFADSPVKSSEGVIMKAFL